MARSEGKEFSDKLSISDMGRLLSKENLKFCEQEVGPVVSSS